MTTLNQSMQNREAVRISKLWRAGLVAAVTAAAANVLLFGLTKLLGVPYIMPLQGPESPLEPLPVIMIIIATVVPTIGATLLLAVLARFLARPLRFFWIISAVFLLLSFMGPFSLPAAVALSTKISLSLMHLITGVVVVWVLSALGRDK